MGPIKAWAATDSDGNISYERLAASGRYFIHRNKPGCVHYGVDVVIRTATDDDAREKRIAELGSALKVLADIADPELCHQARRGGAGLNADLRAIRDALELAEG